MIKIANGICIDEAKSSLLSRLKKDKKEQVLKMMPREKAVTAGNVQALGQSN